MDGIEREYQGKLQVVRLNFSEARNERVIAMLGVRAHPTIVFLDKNGQRQGQRLGPPSLEELRERVDGLLAGSR